MAHKSYMTFKLVSINKVLSEHSHAHSYQALSMAVFILTGRVMSLPQTSLWPAEPKVFIIAPLQKIFCQRPL